MPRAARSSIAAVVVLARALACEDARAAADAPSTHEPLFVRISAFTSIGDGLRFDNPYRLATQLGDTAKSLSRTAPYATIGAAAWFGDATGAQHGPLLRLDDALTGVGQWVVTPSYALSWRATRWSVLGRVGVPLVLTPDANLGGEAAIGCAWFFLAGVGVKAELVGDVFSGAATPTTKRPLYPVLSGELGLVFEWERLP